MSSTILLLCAAVVGLMIGPVLTRAQRQAKGVREALDGFAVVAVSGVALLHLLPEAFEHAGPIALVCAALGLFAPALLERRVSAWSPGLPVVALLLGLAPHAALEAAALSAAHDHELMLMGAVVVAHRLPVGLIVYSMASRRHGALMGWGAIATLIIATVAGFTAGDTMYSMMSEGTGACLTAFVAGSLLHVVGNHHGEVECDSPEHGTRNHRHAGRALSSSFVMGIVTGLATLCVAFSHHSH